MRILVKIGGAQLEEPGPRQQLCQAVARARRDGHELIVVHGGGNQIRRIGKALGQPELYHDGLRITDAPMAETVLMVLGGLVNRTLVAALVQAGVQAVGLSGADGDCFRARKLERPGVDLGYVGVIDRVQPRLVLSLLAAGYVPVLATVAPGGAPGVATAPDAPFYNLNADHAAGPLCRAFGCDALLFLTDVPGVLDHDKQVIARLTPADCDHLVATGVAKGGMLPKLEAAVLAHRENPRALVKIAPANEPDAIVRALRAATGTAFVADAGQTAGLGVDHG
jgi:acetylglutamate kinase